MKNIVVAGIGTGVGKTFVSTVMVEALESDYWKPIQAGDLHQSDSMFVKKFISSSKSKILAEKFCLTQAMSPHAAAAIDQVQIKSSDLIIPASENKVVIELPGGIMVPINSTELNLNLLKMWRAPVLLVANNYLGSINHTLLTIEVLKSHGVPILGIVFNGVSNKQSEELILQYSQLKHLFSIEQISNVDKTIVKSIADRIKNVIKEF